MASIVVVTSVDLAPELGRTVLWRSAVRRTVVSDLDTAFDVTLSLTPSLVLIDRASFEDTVSLVRRLRQDRRTRTTSIVALDRSPVPGEAEALRLAGANAVFSGRVDPLVWDARLEDLISVPARREVRVPVLLRVWSRLGPHEEAFEALALNISVNGILLSTARRLELGTKVDISFRLPGDETELQTVGQVVRDAGSEEGRSESGIRFLIVRGDTRERIRALVASALPPPPEEFVSAGRSTPCATAELQEWEAELRASEAAKAAIVESAFDCIVTMDPEGLILEFNGAAERTFGYARAEVLGRTIAETIIPPSLREMHRRGLARYLSTGESPVIGRRVEMTAMRADGSEFPIELAITPIQLDRRMFFTGYLRDITERKRAEAVQSALYRIAEMASMAKDMPDLFAGIHTIVGELMPAKNFYIALHDEASNTLAFPYFVDEVDPQPRPRKPGKGLTEYVLKTGQPLLASPETFSDLRRSGDVDLTGTRSVDWLGVPLKAGGSTIGVLAVQSYAEATRFGPRERDVLAFVSQHIGDAIERKRVEELLRYQAYHDTLTGLPNRVLLRDRLAVALTRARRHGRQLAVMFLDLDHFKLTNDTLGHAVGDRLLQHVAERLTGRLRAEDAVARVGGDEFTLLFSDLTGADDAVRMAEKVLRLFADAFLVGSHEIRVTASIGIALYPGDSQDAEELLRNADIAMYRAKEQGRNNYQLCAPGMNARALDRMALESQLRRALERGELLLHYQPLVNLKTKHVVGVEALLRWQHPERGLVEPDLFIPIAEDSRLIVPAGEWVLRTACAQLKSWQERGHPRLRMAVNLSARQFHQEDLVKTVRMALDAADVRSECLELEITESVAMQDAKLTTTVLRALQGMGVRISIDDFGTGQSSLSYLQRFPLSTLKIDRSFIREIEVDGDANAIVKAVIALAHTLRLKVIAEGVETIRQLAFLRRARCEEGQGYLFGGPEPAQALGESLKSGPCRAK